MIIHNYLNELWIDIPGVRGAQISSYGRVKRLAFSTNFMRNGTEITRTYPDTILKPSSTTTGYLFVQLIVTETGKQKLFYVHRLVAEAFIPNPDNLPEVNHKNEDKTDNRVENLEWCTHIYNIRYGTRMDRIKQTLIESGNWQDYSGFSDEEKEEFRKKKMKEWYEENKEHIKEWHREYFRNNREQVIAKQKKWCENNKEKVKAIRRKTYENNREHYLEYQRNYNKEHYGAKMEHTVYVYDASTGELIDEFKSAFTAGKTLMISHTTIRNRLKEESLKPIKKKYIVSKNKVIKISEICIQ